jgi:hypothetical protein
LSWFVLLLFASALLLGVYVPIYSDEFATYLLKARVFDENGLLISLLPQCKSSFVSAVPLTWYPAVAFYGIFYSKLNLLGLRLAGVCGALLWISAISFWSFKKAQTGAERLHMVAGLVALSSFGVLPFILILARPEQVMILCLAYYCIVPLFFGDRRLHSFWSRAFVLCSFVLVTSIFHFCHPKSLFFMPLILASGICTVQSISPRILLLLTFFIFLTAYQSFSHADLLYQCDDAPVIRSTLVSFTLDPRLLVNQPKVFFTSAVKNIISAPSEIVHHVLFQNIYQSSWLPPAADSLGDRLADKLNVITSFIYIIMFPVVLILASFKVAKEIIARRMSSHAILATAMAVSLIGHAAFYGVGRWHFYTSGLMIPSLILLVLLIWTGSFEKIYTMKLARTILACLLFFAAMNLCALMANVAPRLIEQSYSRDASLRGQFLSVAPFYFDEQKTTIRALADRCGIKGDGASRLVVDHLTYYAFENLRQPIHALYISELGCGGDISGREIIPFLAEIRSPGIIARCDYIPLELRNAAKNMDGYCCIGEAELSQR